jgi:O-antigen/teichoic acid export membrane protein
MMNSINAWAIQARSAAAPYFRTIARSGSIHLISANLFTQAIGFISSLFVVKFLKPEELADTRVIMTYIGYVQLLSSLGLTASVLTFLPRSSDPGIRRQWMRATLLITFAATVLISMLAAWLSWRGWLMSGENTAYWFRWSLLGCLATTAAGVLIAFYQAERAVRELAGIQSAVRVLVLFVIVGGAWWAGFVGYVVAGIVSSFLMLGGLMAVLPKTPRPSLREPLPAGYIRIAAFTLVGNVLWCVGRTVDVVVLDQLACDRAQFGCYSLVNTIGVVMTLILTTVQVVAVPFFSSHYQDMNWILRNTFRWQIVGAITGVFGAAFAFAGASLLIRFFYGSAYSAATSFLIPVLLAQCLLSTFHLLAAALTGINLVRVNTLVAAIVVPLSVLTTILMANWDGVRGAAWAQVISAAVYACMQSALGWTAIYRKTAAYRQLHSPA